MKLLLVGDVHAQLGSLPECGQLIDFIAQRAEELKPNYIVFLGDLYHTFAIVRVEVMDFWRKAFDRLSAYQVIALVGNHDQSGTGDSHAMVAHQDQIQVVSEPFTVGNLLLLPYYSDAGEFVRAANSFGTRPVVICHQTFQGANYDNGFFAKDGIDLNLLPQKVVISGHIHTESRVGKCWYPGSPRWLTLGDARHNLNKAIWYVDIDTDGGAVTHKKLETHEVCSPIRALAETPESLFAGEFEKNARYVVDLSGPQGWIEERLAFWQGKARVRTFPVEAVAATVRESDGIGVAFCKYAEAFSPKFGTPIATLKQMSKERGIFAI